MFAYNHQDIDLQIIRNARTAIANKISNSDPQSPLHNAITLGDNFLLFELLDCMVLALKKLSTLNHLTEIINQIDFYYVQNDFDYGKFDPVGNRILFNAYHFFGPDLTDPSYLRDQVLQEYIVEANEFILLNRVDLLLLKLIEIFVEKSLFEQGIPLEYASESVIQMFGYDTYSNRIILVHKYMSELLAEYSTLAAYYKQVMSQCISDRQNKVTIMRLQSLVFRIHAKAADDNTTTTEGILDINL